MIEHTRREVAKILQNYNFSAKKSIIFFLLSFLSAYLIAFLPTYDELSFNAIQTLFILIFALGLWVSEAIPAFATSLLVVGLEIILLGDPTHTKEWHLYLSTWSSDLIFLFLSGFILASGASKTKLDFFIAHKVLQLSGTKPTHILFAFMGLTFVFSMFISNTATTAMMLAMSLPLLEKIPQKDNFTKTLLLGIAIAANLGGMGTIIGTPPNAIAVGALGENAPHFLEWMAYGLPPAFLLLLFSSAVLLFLYPTSIQKLEIIQHPQTKEPSKLEKYIVIITFISTLLLWLTSGWHHIPTAVVAFLPIVVFSTSGVLDNEDIRKLPWDVLLLIMGGLSLGLAVSQTGLAAYIAKLLPFDSMGIFALLLSFSYLIIIISNFMSNTAAANILIPIIIAVVSTLYPQNSYLLMTSAIIIALSASNAMMLPISTPPNALVYATDKLKGSDFLKVGIILGAVAPFVVIGWFYLIALLN